ncbi:2-oxoacid:acceptor oxidoreductase subunit alpha [Candidatus Magnetominusculus dajiuhuensis]|uniref:2-oxoacid:acceptor oxidoreductase subunit alpha n=1 Tax=Candidatus Magnetominusculus dajiuhuensis TaxID=3137712 RepID=UPI003B42F4F7
MDYTIVIGGEAGQGLQTIGGVLARLFSRMGYHVFSHQDYMSRVRGGHNYYKVRFGDEELSSSREKAHIIVALDLATIKLHKGGLEETGIIVYDAQFIRKTFTGPEYLNVPFEKIAIETGGDKIMSNTAAVGAVLGMLRLEMTLLEEIIHANLKKKGSDMIDKNILVAKAGYNYAVNACGQCGFSPHMQDKNGHMLIDTSQAIGLGAVMSGCKFYCGYPMTPATAVMNYVASKAHEHSIVVEQTEDEISSINMALGASFAGVRAMTGSSGGGFALMAEGVSLAGMAELPVVITVSQRPGPATGLPTRTEQGDLLFVLHAGHGEFPRVVFAPGNPTQGIHLTNKAFDLAEKYQIPAFIVTDQYIADSQWTYESIDTEDLVYTDYRLREEKGNEMEDAYKRYDFSEGPVSPLAVPGISRRLVVVDSDEHDEDGHMIEDSDTRVKMVQKRVIQKFSLIQQEIDPPLFYGSEKPDIVVTGWGSTYGVIRDAVMSLGKTHNIAMLHFSQIYPFPLTEKFDYLRVLSEARTTICVENNATGQFAYLMRGETGYKFTHNINHFDGRPFLLEGLMGEINERIR